MVKQRSVGVAIILSFITCGLYMIYWMYALTNEVGHLSNDSSFTGGKAVLLSLVTCGIYSIYWYYQLGKHIATAQGLKGRTPTDNGVLFVVLGVFGFGIISMAIAQAEVNKLVQ